MADKKITELPTVVSANISPGTDVIPIVTASDGITKKATLSDAVLAAVAGITTGVSSVNTRTGNVTLTSADVGLGNVNNTSDANKPVSTATQAAIDAVTPSQTGNAGKFLTTNGTVKSWGLVPGGGGTVSSGSIVLTSASNAAQKVSFTAHGQTVTLPDATTLSAGATKFVIQNNSEFVGKLLNSAGTLLAVFAPQDVIQVSVVDVSSSAGSWSFTGGRIAGPTATLSVTGTALGAPGSFQAIPLDATRTFLLYGINGLYGVVYDKSTQTWGTPTLIRASVSASSRGILIAANQIMVCSAITTAMQTIVLSITGTSIALNTATATTLSGAIDVNAGFGDLIAVGTSWVVSYLRATSISGLAAITVSGTTPTVGAESSFAGTGMPAHLYVSGSIVLALGTISGGAGQATPYTVAGSTLTAGTSSATFGTTVSVTSFRTLAVGARWLAYYLDSATGQIGAALISLAGTVASSSAVASVTANDHVNNDAIVCNGKVVISGWNATTSTHFNVLTDTAGVLSKGTAVIINTPTNTSLPVPLSVSGSNAIFASAQQMFQVSAAASSPVIAHLPSIGIDDTYQAPAASNAKGAGGALNVVYGGSGLAILVPAAAQASVAYGAANSQLVLWGGGLNGFPTITFGSTAIMPRARGNTTAELWSLYQLGGNDLRYTLQLVEAA